jgi:hypothetical protein
LLEELGRVHHVTRSLCRMLAETEHIVGLHGALTRMAGNEEEQSHELQRMFARYEAVVPESPGAAALGLMAEMREELRRHSGMYPPAAMDFRLLAELNKLVHHKLAGLRSALIAARMLEADEVARMLDHCLREEVEHSRELTELAIDILRLCGAEAHDEALMAMAGH